MKKAFILFYLLFFTLSTWAYDFKKNGIWYNIVSTTPYTVIVSNDGDNSYSGTLIIPSSVYNNGITYDVKGIGASAFQSCSNLTSIVIPSTIISIYDFAFNSCTGLTSIVIPASVINIGSFVFAGCVNLTSIYANPIYPVNLSLTNNNFQSIDKINCTLYVPVGSANLYSQAYQWKDFENIIETTTDLLLNTTDKIKLYPNPTIEGFNISGLDGLNLMTIIDINSKILFIKEISGNEYISIDFLPKGIYIINITTDNGSFKKKIIKK